MSETYLLFIPHSIEKSCTTLLFFLLPLLFLLLPSELRLRSSPSPPSRPPPSSSTTEFFHPMCLPLPPPPFQIFGSALSLFLSLYLVSFFASLRTSRHVCSTLKKKKKAKSHHRNPAQLMRPAATTVLETGWKEQFFFSF